MTTRRQMLRAHDWLEVAKLELELAKAARRDTTQRMEVHHDVMVDLACESLRGVQYFGQVPEDFLREADYRFRWRCSCLECSFRRAQIQIGGLGIAGMALLVIVILFL